MGILGDNEWKAEWIGAPWQEEDPIPTPPYPKGVNQSVSPYKTPTGNIPSNAPLLRKSFSISRKISSAKAFISGLGFFELYINGKKVSDDVLVPNITLYGKRDDIGNIAVMTGNNFREYRVMYLAYDITGMLKSGKNAAGVILGNGFYNPASFWTQGYGTPRLLCQINVKYDDGSEEIISSDTSWKAAKSPILMDLVYDGEHYDARIEQNGWSSSDFDDTAWENAVIRKRPDGKLKAHMSPTDKVMEVLKPQKIEKLGEGHFRVDFGEEISGWLRFKNVTGENGRRIEIRYKCESPQGENSYIMNGGEPESYAARFTWFVFREAELVNWPGELTADQVQAEAVYTDVETTGKFETSNQLYNTINKIWWRSQTDNMHGGIASDCPHRERSPYTGDGQVACVTVMHNFDAKAFYTKWIRDILGSQNQDNGYVPNGAPWQRGCGGGVAWGAAINIMPWEYYLHYGDKDLLAENYEGMKGYIRYMLTWTDEKGIMYSQAPVKTKPNRWVNLGEWVAPYELPPDQMVHTFYLWRCSDLTASAAKALGNKEDEDYFRGIAEKTRLAFQKEFYNKEKGTYGPYGGNIFALKMGIPEEQKVRVIESLKNDLAQNNYHLDTGIFGTQFLFEVLAENGMQEIAAEIMNQKTYPGYGWWIEQGATTTWEKWDGKGSRNHPMFGGGITWFYRKLAGMNADQEDPGYRHIIFRPQPAKGITWTSYSNVTPWGEAGIRWEQQPASFSVQVKVPSGCTATVYVPAESADKVMESGYPAGSSEAVEFAEMKEGYAVYKVRSGEYSFLSDMNQTGK
jgi:alpha-L-rhamnosidase